MGEGELSYAVRPARRYCEEFERLKIQHGVVLLSMDRDFRINFLILAVNAGQLLRRPVERVATAAQSATIWS